MSDDRQRLGFESKSERNDFLIALLVIALAGAFLYCHVRGTGSGPEQLAPSDEAPAWSDRDEDGIADAADACPDAPGAPAGQGCPPGSSAVPAILPPAGEELSDRDGDGIADGEDACPDEAGAIAGRGCPAERPEAARVVAPAVIAALPEPVSDRDGDGIADGQDACPDQAGVVEAKGCPPAVVGDPDADGDGIPDASDRCPERPGPEARGGCPPEPDSDGDGVPDAADQCPELPGLARDVGCPPDRDGDGVRDAEDRCPDAAGVAANAGCALEGDRDGDAVPDLQDRCPELAGVPANEGCPEAVSRSALEALREAVQNVNFRSASSELLPESLPVLDRVVTVLKDQPDFAIAIEGHTDDRGDDALNLKLSTSRAESCRSYLVEKGIDPQRLTTQGYGESRPVASNDTPAGRLRNRRVEFKLGSR